MGRGQTGTAERAKGKGNNWLEYLLHIHGDLVLIPGIHIELPGIVARACNPNAEKVQSNGSLGFPSLAV